MSLHVRIISILIFMYMWNVDVSVQSQHNFDKHQMMEIVSVICLMQMREKNGLVDIYLA